MKDGGARGAGGGSAGERLENTGYEGEEWASKAREALSPAQPLSQSPCLSASQSPHI